MIRILSAVLLISLAGATAAAQAPPDVVAFSGPAQIEFMSGPIAFDTEPVTGAPYSAEAVTEVVQRLADGNRIVRQHTAQISRDGQGRTRREQGFAMFGPLVNVPGGDGPQNVQISDPTTGTTVMLDLRSKTAHKLPAPGRLMVTKAFAQGGANVNVKRFEIGVPASGGAPAGVGHVMINRMEAGSAAGTHLQEPVVEQLGTTFMEGVAVEGTKTTFTIPAGQIGNERPIDIVSERWFSPDLKVLVMSRQSDPRFGETTYRLTSLTRTEPPAHLFEIPADFKVLEPGTNHDIIIERKMMAAPSQP